MTNLLHTSRQFDTFQLVHTVQCVKPQQLMPMFRVRHFYPTFLKKHKIQIRIQEILTSMLARCFQCYGSGMLIPDPDFYPSRILDLGSNNSNRRGGEKICCLTFICSHKLHKMKIILFRTSTTKICVNLQRFSTFLPQK
jgi:hypothetical protein